MTIPDSIGDPIHVLLVEDDERLASLVSEFLASHGAVVSVARDGSDGLEQALAHRFDVVLLDLMLPDVGGLEVCARLRERSDVPILMVTALDAESERIRGLERGADDYISKPFSTPELFARMRAVVRRHRGLLALRGEPFTVGALELDPASLAAKLGSKRLELTMLEFDLLLCFARNEGAVLSRERILELVHGTAISAFDRSIDGHISRLRRKLGDDPKRPVIIKTVRRAGYLFVAPKRAA
ncbi:MAG: response regulator transcription factor [Polyangiaceae bacterium]|nr:response regulator transcription factor [Polyangiaceae bacterium]